jgi:arylsulfatase A-like enzyme
MQTGSQTIRENIYSGALYGITTWTVYAIVECCFACIISWIIKPSYDYVPLHWGFTTLLFVIYPVIGLIMGGIIGFCTSVVADRLFIYEQIRPSILFPSAVTITIVLAFIFNFIINYSTSSSEAIGLAEFPPLSISLLLIFALLMSSKSITRFRRLRFITNPWTVSIMLLGLPWIHNELLFDYSTTVNALGALAHISGVFLISFFVLRLVRKHFTSVLTTEKFALSGNYLIFLVVTATAVLGFTFFLKQSPILESLNLKTPSSGLRHPNIILITMDTVRADHLSLYGYDRETTPNLKRLSEGATIYTRAVASGDMTLSTHASIFTGMYARQHGAHFDPWNGYPEGQPLSDKFHTMAEILSENGYSTMGIVANYTFLSHHYRLNQGFQYYDNRALIALLADTELYFIRQGIRNILIHFAPRETFDARCQRAEKINSEVFTFLDKPHKKDELFFLFINYMDAHEPYIPPSPFDTMYPGKNETFASDSYFKLAKEVIKLERKATNEEINHLISQYDGEIAYLDFHLGKLIAKLKERGLYENSLIIITSDHGEAFGEKNLFNHGVSVYQDQVFVPLIIKYPNVREKRIVHKIVSVVDILPTVLDVLGSELPVNLKGQSLLKLEKDNLRDVISESFPSGHLRSLHPRFDRIEQALFLGPYKFINSSAGQKQLYNLTKDPHEKENIYQSDNSISIKLEARLNEWLDNTKSEFASSSVKVKPGKETLERLKALGYIQ